MVRFNEYSRFCREIAPPAALKERVLKAVQEPAPGGRAMPGIYCRRSFKLKLIIAAVLVLVFLAAACTMAVSHGLIDRLAQRGLADADTLEGLSSKASESTEPGASQDMEYLAVATDDWAEYRVLKAVCDYGSIYIHFQIVPLDKSSFFIHQMLSPDSPAWELGIPGAKDGTVEEYARSLGKSLRYANIYLSQGVEALPDFGVTGESAPDGSLHIYGSCQNLSDEKELLLSCTAYTIPVDCQSPVAEEDRTRFDVRLQNRSSASSRVFSLFDSEIQEKHGITIESLVIEETELGYYCTFTYRGENAEKTLFSIVDENGEYFQERVPRGSGGNSMNSDGSYSLTVGAPKVEQPEKLMIMLIDENHDKHGPYGFAP